MANLSIDNAYIGYDTDNIQKALNNLNREVIGNAKTKLGSNFILLESSVSRYWIGTSADKFKLNMKSDFEKVKKGLDDCYTILEKELFVIVNAMAKIDQELINDRSGS